MATQLDLFIAGKWTSGTGEGHYELRSPGTGEHLADIPRASKADVDRAVTAAQSRIRGDAALVGF